MAEVPDLRPDEKREQMFKNHFMGNSRGMYPGAIKSGVPQHPIYITGINKIDAFAKLNYGHCNPLEMDYFRCASRVGLENVHRGNDCLRELEDMRECISNAKATMRRAIMKKEARRQGKPFMEEPVPYTTIRFNNDGCHVPFQ